MSYINAYRRQLIEDVENGNLSLIDAQYRFENAMTKLEQLMYDRQGRHDEFVRQFGIHIEPLSTSGWSTYQGDASIVPQDESSMQVKVGIPGTGVFSGPGNTELVLDLPAPRRMLGEEFSFAVRVPREFEGRSVLAVVYDNNNNWYVGDRVSFTEDAIGKVMLVVVKPDKPGIGNFNPEAVSRIGIRIDGGLPNEIKDGSFEVNLIG